MEQMIDISESPVEEISEFYDNLSVDYDMMTNFDKRFVHERPFFTLLTQRYGITTALDAGSGTGFHSLLLGQLGVRMTALDVSSKMLDRLKIHARDRHIHIDVVESGFQHLPRELKNNFDAVLCMGNSLSHLLSEKDLHRSLKNFSAVLHPDGALIIQILNYDRILANRERVQSVKESANTTFVRFYDFHNNFIVFNILRLKKVDGRITETLHSVRLRPLVKNTLMRAVQESGFGNVRTYGSIALDDFDEKNSKDLFIVAQKNKALN